ncbi:MAG: hypothetical protein AB7N54_20075 [Alphaproteobacteria bacterium]
MRPPRSVRRRRLRRALAGAVAAIAVTALAAFGAERALGQALGLGSVTIEQTPCGQLADFLTLVERTGGHPTASGPTSDGGLVLLLAWPDGRWSLLHADGDGATCVIAGGTDWESTAPRAPGKGT